MIGVFDSGIGGLSVLGEIRSVLPDADMLYVADRARAPYGNSTLAEVEAMSHEIAAWLVDRGCETVVIACNTASAAALHSLRDRFPSVAIVGMEPAVKPAAENTMSGVIGVFATAATFQGELFDSVVERHGGNAEIIARACPQWVELIEAGTVEGASVEDAVAAEVRPVVEARADVLVLGCTHFSFLYRQIQLAAGPGIIVIDPAPAVAAQVARVAVNPGSNGIGLFAASGDLDEFARLAAAIGHVVFTSPPLPFP